MTLRLVCDSANINFAVVVVVVETQGSFEDLWKEVSLALFEGNSQFF